MPMNTLQQLKLKLQIRIDPAIEFGAELLRDVWQQVLAEREARIKLMTDGHLDRQYGTRIRKRITSE
jgi:hypothetical protein